MITMTSNQINVRVDILLAYVTLRNIFFNTQTVYRSDSSFPNHITGVIGSVLSSNVRLWV